MTEIPVQQEFYRRPLPVGTCVDFSSASGKQLFQRALLQGNAEIYFRLASQFVTQEEPAYCGLATLVMVLNALEVDPGRVWRGPWRFYHPEMLDCCKPLDEIKREGITMEQFICLASCNRLSVESYFARRTPEFLLRFRADVVRSTQSECTVLVVCYSRKSLGQTGGGHFSPIGAYDPETDSALILDVARFKYPPHWVKLELLQEAMLQIDNSIDMPRGYLMLELNTDTRPSIAFSLEPRIFKEAAAIEQLRDVCLRQNDKARDEELLDSLIPEINDRFGAFIKSTCVCSSFTETKKECRGDGGGGDEACSMVHEHRLVANSIRECVLTTTIGEACLRNLKLERPQVAASAALFLAWPFQTKSFMSSGSESAVIHSVIRIVDSDQARLDKESRNEIRQLNAQLRTLLCCESVRSTCNPRRDSSCCSAKQMMANKFGGGGGGGGCETAQ